MSKSLCTKKEFDISYYYPRLSLNPEQSKKTIWSMIILAGTRVSENLSCPILSPSLSSESSIVFNPIILIYSFLLARNDSIVVLPTPVSPITNTALLNLGSAGMEAIPESINLFNLSRFKLLSYSCITEWSCLLYKFNYWIWYVYKYVSESIYMIYIYKRYAIL